MVFFKKWNWMQIGKKKKKDLKSLIILHPDVLEGL